LATLDQALARRRTDKPPRVRAKDRAKVKDRAVATDVAVAAVVEAAAAVKAVSHGTRIVPLTHR
jgi:hypothetical protein